MFASESTDLEEFSTREPGRESALVRFLYPAPAGRTVGQIVKWWEKRRLGYNAVLAGCGMGTVAMALLTLNPPLEVLRAVAVPGLPFMILANVCYTLGWVVESFLHKIWGRGLLPAGPALFRAGLTLAVGLSFVVPVIMIVIVFVARIATGDL